MHPWWKRVGQEYSWAFDCTLLYMDFWIGTVLEMWLMTFLKFVRIHNVVLSWSICSCNKYVHFTLFYWTCSRWEHFIFLISLCCSQSVNYKLKGRIYRINSAFVVTQFLTCSELSIIKSTVGYINKCNYLCNSSYRERNIGWLWFRLSSACISNTIHLT